LPNDAAEDAQAHRALVWQKPQADPAGRIMLRITAARAVHDTLPMAAASPGSAIFFHRKPALKIVCHAAQSFFSKHVFERSFFISHSNIVPKCAPASGIKAASTRQQT